MEILIRNKRNTAKLCLKVEARSVGELDGPELAALLAVLEANDGYRWEPVRDGYARGRKLPLVPAAVVCEISE